MSEFKTDFVNEEQIDFEIEGRKFSYIPVTAGDENDWLPKYTYIEDGKIKQDLSILNKYKIAGKLVKVPYDKEDIKEIIGVDKEWNELDLEQKWKLLRKIKPNLFDKIVSKINEINTGANNIKKKD